MQTYAPNAVTPHPKLTELPPLAMDRKTLDEDFLRYYNRTLGRDKQHCTDHYLYEALAYTVRDRLMERWKETRFAYEEKDARRTCYLSLEFLMGRALSNAMLNLGVTDAVTQVLYDYGITLEEVEAAEHDAGLGNGGLGRLAACFLDSCATLQLPVLGYGLRYEYGMFRQEVINGYQIEEPDHWLRDGNPWELERPEYTQRIHFGGRTEFYRDENRHLRVRWVDTHDVLAVPYDIPVPGYRNDTVNSLRLWKSTATDEFDLDEFNAGDYSEAVASKNNAEHITMVLYPNDASENGKELRLRQQYFLASASLKDVLRRWVRLHEGEFTALADKHCFQLNDTHPSYRRGRADASAGRRASCRLGRGVGHRQPFHGLYQPHAVARSAGKVAAADVRKSSAAPARDHLRNQRTLSRRRITALARRYRPPAPHVDHRGRRHTHGAHGLSRHCRQFLGKRGGGTAFAAAAGRPVRGFLPALAAQVQQQNQRRHPAALADHVQPRPVRAYQRTHR